MTKIELQSKTRDIVGKKMRKYRAQGLVPAVMYGHKIAAQNLWVNFLDFRKVYEKVGESTIIELGIDGGKKINVLIHDAQYDPLTSQFSHIDFFQVRMDEELETAVQLEFVGESPAIKEMGGMLIKGVDALQIKCLPADLPAKIEVDISKIKNFDEHITVEDLGLSEKIKVLIDGNTIIASVAAPRTEEELAQLNEKVEEDVTKVAGVVKETSEEAPAEVKKENKK